MKSWIPSRLASLALVVLISAMFGAQNTQAQMPDEYTNLQVLPEDISRDSLVNTMRRMALSLGVRCQFCHAGGDGVSFEGVDFASDDKPQKDNARFMMRMVDALNQHVIPTVPEPNGFNVRIQCKTCHRKRSRPWVLTDELRVAMDSGGAENARDRYDFLKQSFSNDGAFDFGGEWEVNLLAEDYLREGKTEEGIAIYLLNEDNFPESTSIKFSLAAAYRDQGDTDQALEYYRKVLDINPNHRGASRGVEELESGG